MKDTTKRTGRGALALVLALALLAPAAPAGAKQDGGGKPGWAGQGGHGKPDKAAKGLPAQGGRIQPKGGAYGPDADRVLASGATAAVIASLLGGQTQVLQVGAKPLPPGIRKNLARGKPLPPGIARQAVPQPLLARLPVVDGHTWIRVGTELVLIGIAGSLIAQVIDNVFG